VQRSPNGYPFVHWFCASISVLLVCCAADSAAPAGIDADAQTREIAGSVGVASDADVVVDVRTDTTSAGDIQSCAALPVKQSCLKLPTAGALSGQTSNAPIAIANAAGCGVAFAATLSDGTANRGVLGTVSAKGSVASVVLSAPPGNGGVVVHGLAAGSAGQLAVCGVIVGKPHDPLAPTLWKIKSLSGTQRRVTLPTKNKEKTFCESLVFLGANRTAMLMETHTGAAENLATLVQERFRQTLLLQDAAGKVTSSEHIGQFGMHHGTVGANAAGDVIAAGIQLWAGDNWKGGSLTSRLFVKEGNGPIQVVNIGGSEKFAVWSVDMPESGRIVAVGEVSTTKNSLGQQAAVRLIHRSVGGAYSASELVKLDGWLWSRQLPARGQRWGTAVTVRVDYDANGKALERSVSVWRLEADKKSFTKLIELPSSWSNQLGAFVMSTKSSAAAFLPPSAESCPQGRISLGSVNGGIWKF